MRRRAFFLTLATLLIGLTALWAASRPSTPTVPVVDGTAGMSCPCPDCCPCSDCCGCCSS